MGGEMGRQGGITQGVEEEMEKRKEKRGAYTKEDVLRQLEEQIKKLGG